MSAPLPSGETPSRTAHANVDVDMVRDNMTGFPRVELPQGYRFRMWRPGDDATWTALQTAAEPYIPVTPELYVRQFGANEDALPDRMFFVETEAGEAIASITAWWARDRHNPNERGRIHWVVVHPAHQRRGITKPMMTVAMTKLAEHYRTAMLGTSVARVWAIKVYLDYGFYPDPKQWERPEIREGWHRVQAQLNHPLLAHWIARLDG